MLLTLEVNLHHYSLTDSLGALKKHCTSEEHPCSGHLGFLGRKLLNPAPRAPLWDYGFLFAVLEAMSLRYQESPWDWQKDSEAAWITIRLGLQVLSEPFWKWLQAFPFAQKAAGSNTVLQSLNIYAGPVAIAQPKAHHLPFVYPVWFCPSRSPSSWEYMERGQRTRASHEGLRLLSKYSVDDAPSSFLSPRVFEDAVTLTVILSLYCTFPGMVGDIWLECAMLAASRIVLLLLGRTRRTLRQREAVKLNP